MTTCSFVRFHPFFRFFGLPVRVAPLYKASRSPQRRHVLQAFSLVEVTLALGIAAFGLVTLLGLLPVGFNTVADAREQTAAASTAGQIAADLRQTPSSSTSAVSTRYQITVPAPGAGTVTQTVFVREGGDPLGNVLTADARYRATVTLIPPAAGQRGAVTGRIVMGWPAFAAASRPTGQVEVFVGLDRD